VINWFQGLLLGLETLNQIFAAGIAITAFSLLLYALTFNLRDRVARSFALILVCVVIVFSSDAISSASSNPAEVEFWLRFQWVGILFLPPSYLHFSDAILATTGRPSRGKRRWAIRIAYLVSAVMLATIFVRSLIGPVVWNTIPAPHLQRTWFTEVFTGYYILVMGMSWYNLIRAHQRSLTRTSRRRMAYLLAGALSPALGSFPYLMFGSDLAANLPLVFWLLSTISNLLVAALIVIMAYAVAFFGVPWPDRVVKGRLFKWLLRGPFTACIVLALVTLVRRVSAAFGDPAPTSGPVVMVITILLIEYAITLLYPTLERWLFFGQDRKDLTLIHTVEERLLTENDLRQFLEMVLAAVCDRLQSPSGFIVELNHNEMKTVVQTGLDRMFNTNGQTPKDLVALAAVDNSRERVFAWGDYLLVPLRDNEAPLENSLLGLMGVTWSGAVEIDEDHLAELELLATRAQLALKDRILQQQVFQSLQSLNPRVELIQRMRAAARYDSQRVLIDEPLLPNPDMAQWVKEALTHYWGGPRLTESPLLKLRVVQEAMDEHNGNSANALRAILRKAIDQVKPEGERRFTGEWILYNILEMKFLEGKMVREIAMRLAMSEADLYRKQRIAIEAVAKAIMEMEVQSN
jgi:hypothetical protein